MVEEKQWILTAQDRCDAKECGAQAYVFVKGISGELLFCAHHFSNLNSEKINKFAFEIINETERLIENKTQGNYY